MNPDEFFEGKTLDLVIQGASWCLGEVVRTAIGKTPIEQRLCAALLIRAMWDGFATDVVEGLNGLGQAKQVLRSNPRHPLLIFSQLPIADLRPDFVVGWQRYQIDEPKLIAVECDGHEFHEKTKQQASRDKWRDRQIVIEGVAVMRFSGSDIHHAPLKCAAEVLMPLVAARQDEELKMMQQALGVGHVQF